MAFAAFLSSKGGANMKENAIAASLNYIHPLAPRVVNFGVDTMLVNFKMANEEGKPNGDALPDPVIKKLDEWQAVARKEHKPVPTPLEYRGQTLFIRPFGDGNFPWLLFNEDIKLAMAYGSLNGDIICQARFSSQLLWSVGPEAALTALQAKLYELVNQMIYAQMSEIHLCADIAGWYDGPLNWQEAFVSRVRNIRARPDEVPTEREQEGGLSPKEIRQLNEPSISEEPETNVQPVVTTSCRRLATLDFGTHGSELMGQIYNKTKEIKKSKKTYFEPIFVANGWDGKSVIWRNEFRFRRKWLADRDLNDAYEVLSQLRLLWEYATYQWLRYVDLSSHHDTNKSRLPADYVWSCIQRAFDLEQVEDLLTPEGEEQVRLSMLLDEQPLAVLKDAATMTLEEQLEDEPPVTDEGQALTWDDLSALLLPLLSAPLLALVMMHVFIEQSAKQVVSRLTSNYYALDDSLKDVAPDVLRELAVQELSLLSAEQVSSLVNHLSPEPFLVVRPVLVKRERRMAKKKMCVSALSGYLTSLMALCVHEVADVPDLRASVLVALEEVSKYNKQRGRVHVEEVLKKQLAFGFITAQQLDYERRVHGVDLAHDDWLAVETLREEWRKRPADVWLAPDDYGYDVA
jgi:hypothetical protein